MQYSIRMHGLIASEPTRLAILDHAALLADLTRCRILSLLEGQELTVSELCAALQLPQSTVSRHLKLLADAGLVQARREGTSRLYQLLAEALGERARAPVGARARGARGLPHLPAGRGSPGERAGRASHALAGVLLGLGGRVGPAARRALRRAIRPGGATGAPRPDYRGRRSRLRHRPASPQPCALRGACHRGRSLARDAGGARERLRRLENVEVRQGELEKLPFASAELDLATLFLALHHVAEPARALAEAGRVLKPAGRLLVVDMMPHDHSEYRQQMGHVWLGFARTQLERLLEAARFSNIRYLGCRPSPRPKGRRCSRLPQRACPASTRAQARQLPS